MQALAQGHYPSGHGSLPAHLLPPGDDEGLDGDGDGDGDDDGDGDGPYHDGDDPRWTFPTGKVTVRRMRWGRRGKMAGGRWVW